MAAEEVAPKVICAGLSCLDMILTGSEYPLEPDSICRFTGTSIISGGSAPNTSCALARLGVPVAAVTLLGNDVYGDQLVTHLKDSGVDTSRVLRREDVATSLAVVPVYDKGGRGCFVNLGANSRVTANDLFTSSVTGKIKDVPTNLRVFHFGYPHLLPRIQGNNLKQLLAMIRKALPTTIISVDVNGADVSEEKRNVLSSALPLIGMLHANLSEASRITNREGRRSKDVDGAVHSIASWFTDRGVGIMCITCSQFGAHAKTSEDVILKHHQLPQGIKGGYFAGRGAYELSGELNSTGAGDSFVGGCIAALVEEEYCTIETLLDAGLAASLQRIDASRASKPLKYRPLMRSMDGVKRLSQDIQKSFQALCGE